MKDKMVIFCSAFISRQQKLFMDNYVSLNQTGAKGSVDNYRPDFEDARWANLEKDIASLGYKQRLAYDEVVKHICGQDSKQFLMFMSGE